MCQLLAEQGKQMQCASCTQTDLYLDAPHAVKAQPPHIQWRLVVSSLLQAKMLYSQHAVKSSEGTVNSDHHTERQISQVTRFIH